VPFTIFAVIPRSEWLYKIRNNNVKLQMTKLQFHQILLRSSKTEEC